jgi:hypothetical protein
LAETCRNAGYITDYIGLVGHDCQRIRFHQHPKYRDPEHHLSDRRNHLDSANAPVDDLDGDGVFPGTTSSLKT